MAKKKILVIVSKDKLGRLFLSQAPLASGQIFYAYDKSRNPQRILKLIRRQSLSLPTLFKMTLAEMMRKGTEVTLEPQYSVKNNSELQNLIFQLNIEKVFLFRAGLIISSRTQQLPVEFLNIHCAKIPEYGGIGVLDRALREKSYMQEATLHRVIDKIDGGEVLRTLKYTLDPNISYIKNENLAYSAGAKLLKEALIEEIS